LHLSLNAANSTTRKFYMRLAVSNFLADRINCRAIGRLLRLSCRLSVCKCDVMYCS